VVEASDVRGDEGGHCHETHDIRLAAGKERYELRILEARVPQDAVRLELRPQHQELVEVPLLLLARDLLHIRVVVVSGVGGL